ncbi:putative aldouronate transport system substrate-binding protein [Paenibacillus endophyticus]|uniref:Putative aldouronate transport system substrate-binding protein n=1 Tax=Paenibacillus endophyticus TaxID=1294268 RepID=A0A7W5C711_9BACL|nr:extracellular solute-binding protein [Paenibacillus endophyticus]MBB3152327.1 putative aldouronate transport system substrate-binding protein [Paenibacillus endophyticus]
MTKRGTKKTLTVSMVMILIAVIFAGCSGNNGNNNAPTNSAASPAATNGEAAAEETPAAPDLTPVEFTINTSDDQLKWDTPINKKITEKTGVTFKYDLTVGDQFQRWDLWLASKDYPDIIVLDPKYTLRYKEAGAIIPLNDLIEKYGPNIKEKFGDKFNLLKDENGDIYSLYSVLLAKEAPADATGNFIVQYDVLKEAGYPEIKTFDQLYEVIKAYKTKHPQVDGKDTIGFGAYMNGWVMKHAFNNPIIWGSGLADHGNYTISDSGEVDYNPVSEATKTYYQFLNKLNNEGMLDKESFSMDEKAFQAKAAQGRILAAYSPNWLLGDAEKSLRAAGQPERAYAHIPIYFNENVVDHSNSSTPTSAGNYQWTISSKTKNPERIIQMIDYLFSDEAQVLTQWGIEGEDYSVVDGKRTVNPELVTKRQTDANIDYDRGFKSVGTGNTFWFGVGHGAKLADGDYSTPLTKDVVELGYDDMTKEVLAKYGKQVWADFLAPVEYVPGFLWQLTPPEATKVEEQKMDDTWRKNIPKIILSKDAAAFEKSWSQMVTEIDKAGVKKVNEAYTKLWKEFIEKYNQNIAG